MADQIVIARLPSGYWHVRLNRQQWSQPPHWPCDEETLRAHAFDNDGHGCSDEFVRLAMETARHD